MAILGNVYANAVANAFQGAINLNSDSIKFALLGAGYSPNLTSHVHWSDVSASEIAATGGYTAGGQALTSKSVTVTAASTWGVVWAASSSFAQGLVVRPASANGFLYYAEAGGTSGSSAPTWPTALGATVVDGTVTWTNIGDSMMQFTSASVNYTSSTISANYAVIYDSQSGTPSTEPLIALIQFGTAISSSSSTWTATPNALGWFVIAAT